MKIQQHLFSPAIQSFSCVFLILLVALCPFKYGMFEGKAALLQAQYLSLCFGASVLGLLLPIISVMDVRAYDWYLEESSLFKKRRGTLEEIARVDLQDVLRHRYGRVVPFIGRGWNVQLTMKEVVVEAPVLLTIRRLKITGMPGRHRRYDLRYISGHDKDLLLAAIGRAKGGVIAK